MLILLDGSSTSAFFGGRGGDRELLELPHGRRVGGHRVPRHLLLDRTPIPTPATSLEYIEGDVYDRTDSDQEGQGQTPGPSLRSGVPAKPEPSPASRHYVHKEHRPSADTLPATGYRRPLHAFRDPSRNTTSLFPCPGLFTMTPALLRATPPPAGSATHEKLLTRSQLPYIASTFSHLPPYRVHSVAPRTVHKHQGTAKK